VAKDVLKKNIDAPESQLKLIELDDVDDIIITKDSERPYGQQFKGQKKFYPHFKEGVNPKGKERWSIEITPEMADKIKRGVALFSAGAITTKAVLEEKETGYGHY
jgi:hypothetical protein